MLPSSTWCHHWKIHSLKLGIKHNSFAKTEKEKKERNCKIKILGLLPQNKERTVISKFIAFCLLFWGQSWCRAFNVSGKTVGKGLAAEKGINSARMIEFLVCEIPLVGYQILQGWLWLLTAVAGHMGFCLKIGSVIVQLLSTWVWGELIRWLQIVGVCWVRLDLYVSYGYLEGGGWCYCRFWWGDNCYFWFGINLLVATGINDERISWLSSLINDDCPRCCCWNYFGFK